MQVNQTPELLRAKAQRVALQWLETQKVSLQRARIQMSTLQGGVEIQEKALQRLEAQKMALQRLEAQKMALQASEPQKFARQELETQIIALQQLETQIIALQQLETPKRTLYGVEKSAKILDLAPEISIVIPAFNESGTIGAVLQQIRALPFRSEIVIVDDGSTDGTSEIIKKIPGVRIIRHPKNKGYGQSITDGVAASGGQVIVTMDADGQHDPRDIPDMVHAILAGKCDLAIGSRYKGSFNYPLPLSTRLGEAIIEFLLTLIFGIRVGNNQSGFRAFTKSFTPIFESLKFRGFALTTEILMRAGINGYRVRETPIHLKQRAIGKSRVKIVRLLFSLAHAFVYYLGQVIKPHYLRCRLKQIKMFFQFLFTIYKR